MHAQTWVRRDSALVCGLMTVAVAPLLVLLGPSAVADETYSPAVPTTCTVVVARVEAGQRPVATLDVSAAGSARPTGTVRVRIGAGGDAAQSHTVRYDGAPAELRGSRLAPGRHPVAMVFTPDDPGRFLGCDDVSAVQVGQAGADDEVGGASATGLPNTGGPPLTLLLAGVGLVLAGGGLVRRPATRPTLPSGPARLRGGAHRA